MKKYEILIGIDPDVDKSGVALSFNGKLTLLNLTFFDLYDYLKNCQSLFKSFLVVIEKGESNKALFNSKGKKSVASTIGMKTGRNFEVTNKIAEMCEYLKIDYEFYVPTSQKLSHDYLNKIVELPKRTNEEQRDAVRCILKYLLI